MLWHSSRSYVHKYKLTDPTSCRPNCAVIIEFAKSTQPMRKSRYQSCSGQRPNLTLQSQIILILGGGVLGKPKNDGGEHQSDVLCDVGIAVIDKSLLVML